MTRQHKMLVKDLKKVGFVEYRASANKDEFIINLDCNSDKDYRLVLKVLENEKFSYVIFDERGETSMLEEVPGETQRHVNAILKYLEGLYDVE